MNGEMEKKGRKKGGLRTVPFILVTEICERFAMTGFNANLITYLTDKLHMPLVQASNTLTNFAGTAMLTPIIGGAMADSFAGRFWTIFVGTIFYQLGMVVLTVSAVLRSLHPGPCTAGNVCPRATPLHLLFLYVSLVLKSVGSGGIRPCVVPFGADQFDFNAPGPGMKRYNFFNLYFFSMDIAALLALTVVVWVQDNVSWGWGLGIPTVFFFLSLLVFIAGYPMYVRLEPGGSPLTRLAQVMVAALRKRRLPTPADPTLLYQNKELDAVITVEGRLLHTNHLKFLDRAAMATDGDLVDGGRPRPWRLSTVHRVEELKSIVRMIPIWSVGIMTVTATSHNHTFAVRQAKTMNRHLSPSFQISPATMSIFSVFSMLLGLAFYDRIFVPVVRRFTNIPSGITYFQRMGIGHAISVLPNVAAALVESKRKAAAAEHGLLDSPEAVVPVSVFWMVPQYAIGGLAGTFSSVGHMEFMYDQSPESMRSTATALFWLAASIGNYTGTFLVTLVSNVTKKRGNNWLQDNLNRGKLDNYYWLVAVLQFINLLYYILCAIFYTAKPLDIAMPDQETKPNNMVQIDDQGRLGAP